jgi:four helix bundle protein
MVIEVYRISREFPPDERFGLVSQLRRSAASIPANIAEGSGRNSDREFSRFLTIATGSASETEYHILLAHDLKFIRDKDFAELDRRINEIKRMLCGFMKKLTPDT